MSRRVCASALLALVVAACGGENGIVEPRPQLQVKQRAVAAIGTDPATGATIETDLDDYAPGGVVTLTGRGWAANESVHLVMTEDPDRHPDVVSDVQADGAGAFTLRFYDVQESDLGVRFTLTGTGATSGSKVTVQFTDQRNLTAIVLTPTSPFAPGTSVSAQAEVVLNTGGGGPTTWLGTKWEVRNASNVVVASSPAPCINTPDHSVGDSDASGNKHYESVSFTAPAAGSYTLTVSVFSTDNCALAGDATSMTVPFTVSASNTAPTVSAGADVTINEGATFTRSGSFTDPDANSWTATVDYGDGSGVQSLALTLPAKTFDLSHTYTDNGSFTVKVTVNDGTASGTDEVAVTVDNVAPTATFNTPASVAGGSSFGISLTSPVDPSSADVTAGFTYAFDCGTGYGAFSATSSATCPGAAPTSVTVKGKIKDKDEGVTEYTRSVAVDNVAPIAAAGGPYSGDEGSSISLTGSGSDPDGGAVSYEWSTNAPIGTCSFTNANSASTSVTCNDNGSWTVSLKVTDDEQASTTSTVALTVANVAPTIGAKTDGANVNEGSSIAFAVSNVTDPSTADATNGFTYAFACDGVTFGNYGASSTVNCPAGDGPGSVTIAAKAKDKDDGVSTAVSSTFTVKNVAPMATFSAPSPVNEGSSIGLSLTSPSDPSADDVEAGFQYAFDCGTGSGYGAYSATSTATCATNDNGSRSVKGKIKDKDGGETEYTASVTVNNVAPTGTFAADTPVNEGSSFGLSLTNPNDASSVDVAAGFTYAFDCGDGYGAFASAATKSCPTSDNGTRTAKGKIRDKDGGETEYTGSVTVNNVAPVVGMITAPTDPVKAGVNVSTSVSFTDVGTGDTHTALWNWGDGSTSAGSITESNGSGSATGNHTYSAPGVYTVAVTIGDDDGGSGQAQYQYVVVYDPNAGFVTGGGWITSPAGAYVPDPSLSGKATFGFVSKYKKGATTPDGSTEFQFHAAGMNFKSTVYEWLVVSGARAQFKGSGTINGSGNYGFLLTATDGQTAGGGGSDKFRIKIVDKTTGNVVYDNVASALDDDLTAGTVISNGSIQIQSK